MVGKHKSMQSSYHYEVKEICYSWSCLYEWVCAVKTTNKMLQMKTFQPYFLVYSIYSDYFLADSPLCHSTILSVRVFSELYVPRGRSFHYTHSFARSSCKRRTITKRSEKNKKKFDRVYDERANNTNISYYFWENIMCAALALANWMRDRIEKIERSDWWSGEPKERKRERDRERQNETRYAWSTHRSHMI